MFNVSGARLLSTGRRDVASVIRVANSARHVRPVSFVHINEEIDMAGDRELIEPNEGDKRYVRRDDEGEFTDSQDDVSRSLSHDVRTDAKTEVEKGQGDRGDRKD